MSSPHPGQLAIKVCRLAAYCLANLLFPAIRSYTSPSPNTLPFRVSCPCHSSFCSITEKCISTLPSSLSSLPFVDFSIVNSNTLSIVAAQQQTQHQPYYTHHLLLHERSSQPTLSQPELSDQVYTLAKALSSKANQALALLFLSTSFSMSHSRPSSDSLQSIRRNKLPDISDHIQTEVDSDIFENGRSSSWRQRGEIHESSRSMKESGLALGITALLL
ncbi:hypothetical protein NXS19_012955 [Fusarium pseudograminearum]|nr:hypothetical protein NXS19_012955 [Fusarium pseudograminearum]